MKKKKREFGLQKFQTIYSRVFFDLFLPQTNKSNVKENVYMKIYQLDQNVTEADTSPQ